MKLLIPSAKNVAEYYLMLSQPEIGDYMSNLRLQKLVYYAQGFHLAKFDSPLFGDPIVAWNYGPVIEDLYHEYKSFRSGVIPKPSNPDFSMFTTDQKELMNEVFVVYGQFSALKLMELTHKEEPWISTAPNGVISQDIMRKYFKKRLRG